jgi:hypothetical protein
MNPLQECVDDLIAKAVEHAMKNGEAHLTVEDVQEELGGIYPEDRIKICLKDTANKRINCQLTDSGNILVTSAFGGK